MNKPCLIVLLAVTSCITIPAHARYYFWFHDPIYDMAWVDSLMSSHQQMAGRFAAHFESVGPSKEEREEIKQARENLAKITHEIKEDESSVTVAFKGFTGLAKDDVKVVKKDTGWHGMITLKEGRIEFFISPLGLQVSSCIELKKEAKADNERQEKKVINAFYTSQSATQADLFHTSVNLQTLKGEVKPAEFILTIQKQKEEVLQLS